MNNVRLSLMSILAGFAMSGFAQVVQPAVQQPAAAVAVTPVQTQIDQLRQQAAQLQAQAAQLLAQAQALVQQQAVQQPQPQVVQQPQPAPVQVVQVPVAPAPVQTVQVNAATGLISMADAKRIALQAAGVAETDARNMKVELDSEGAMMVYEVEFKSGIHEYEYKVDARSGTIVGTKKEVDLF